MTILALETSTTQASLALEVDGQVYQQVLSQEPKVTEQILPAIEALLAQYGLSLEQLQALAVSIGPGAFTGVRVGVSVAQALSFGADVPVVGISSLQALAYQAWQASHYAKILTINDARMHEVYWAAYEINDENMVSPSNSEIRVVEEEKVGPPSSVVCPFEKDFLIVGDALRLYPHLAFPKGEIQTMVLQASSLIPLAHQALANGQGLKGEQLVPKYVRNQVVQIPSKLINK